MAGFFDQIATALKHIVSYVPIGDSFLRDRRQFIRNRAEFYSDLSETMEEQPSTRLALLIERIAERRSGDYLGRLANRWLQEYAMSSSFAEALRSCIPREDYTPLRVAEESSEIRIGLSELAKVVSAMDKTRETMMTIWISTGVLCVIVQVFIGYYAFKIVPTIEKALPRNVQIEDLGQSAVIMHDMSYLVRHFWPIWLALVVALIFGLKWAVPNYIGKGRIWLDRHVLHFSLYAEFQSASFLTSLSSITRRMSNRVIPVPQALEIMQETASPWLAQHIEKILVNLEVNPFGKGEVFKTGMTNKKVEYRMIDISEHKDVSAMLALVGEKVLTEAPKLMERRAATIQWVARIIIVAVVLGLQLLFNAMTYGFQDAVSVASYGPNLMHIR